jgi:hypothetical protein
MRNMAVRAERSNRADGVSGDVKRAVRPRKRELDADGLLRIARSIPPDVAAQLEAFFAERKEQQLRIKRRKSSAGA